jgi:sugar lactone lactonase YvrE
MLILAMLLAVPAVAEQVADLPPAEAVKPELYATGFEFAEGPAFDAAGNLYVVNYRGNGNIGRITPDGTASVFCDLRQLLPVEGRKPQANGLKVDRQGRVIAADAGGGRVLRIAADGKSGEVLADRYEGKPLNVINDVALDHSGNIYFTDPGNSSAEKPTGSVYRYDIATAAVTRLDTGLAYPNGIGVTPDQRHLCVSGSEAHCVWIHDLSPRGEVSNRRVLIEFAKVPGIRGTEFVPDGLVFDAQGRLYVAMWSEGLIHVVEVPSGKLLRQYDAGGLHSSNCHFFGDYLYTTVATKEAVFRLKLGVAGDDYRGEK